MEMMETGLLGRRDGVSKIVETGVCLACSVVCEKNHLAGIDDFVQSCEIGLHGS